MTCRKCGERLSPTAKFCGGCGELVLGTVAPPQLPASDPRPSSIAIGVVFCGVLITLLVEFGLSTRFDSTLIPNSVHWIGLLIVGFVAIWFLGRGALRSSTLVKTELRHWGWGVVGGIAQFAIGFLYVLTLSSWLVAEEERPISSTPLWEELLFTGALTPVFEEWLCRGVLWSASRRVLSTRGTIVLTSALFAMMHGLGGGFLLEFPHRFLGGIILGVLRARTRSLGPSVLAHGLNNFFAVMISR